jgi:hypothetical protein
MKKIYLIAAAMLAISAATYAQTQRDWFIIGGQLSNMNLDFQKGGTSFSMDLTPRVAWFMQDNMAFGAEALIGVNASKGITQFRYGIGPIARFYFADRTPKITNKAGINRRSNLFLDANFGFYGQNSKSSGESTVSTNGLGFGIGPGLAYFINPNIALEGLVKYNFTSNFTNSIDVNKNSNSLSFRIGFQIHLPRARLRQLREEVK